MPHDLQPAIADASRAEAAVAVRSSEVEDERVRRQRIGTGSTALDGLIFALLLTVIMAVGAISLAGTSPVERAARAQVAARSRVVPPDAVPEVEPTRFQALAPDDARAFNAAIPFSAAPNPPARPFAFPGGGEDRLRALDCLTAAVLYEAGNDEVGQRSVAQVVLNRARHPAFPQSICGVVFQGSERRTGCQFTFTCDGALIRTYSEPLWDRARAVADAALSGAVYKPVGQATHYHTDWVVPYWSSSLDKIVAVHSHLFFRWTGWWGTPPAFRMKIIGVEPRIAKLSSRFPEHGAFVAGALPIDPNAVADVTPATLPSGDVRPVAGDPDAFRVLLSAKDAANFAQIAAFQCGVRSRCKVMAWTDAAAMPRDPSAKLAPAQLATASFTYLRDRSIKLERALWNCAEFKRPAGQCMWSKSSPPEPKPAPQKDTAAAVPPAAVIPKLNGVRFKADQQP